MPENIVNCYYCGHILTDKAPKGVSDYPICMECYDSPNIDNKLREMAINKGKAVD
jgi:hypothetical protein